MEDRIVIEGLEIFGNHGVLQEENALGQKFIISVVMQTSVERAGISDDLNCTVNYAQVCDFVNSFVKENTFKLIETLAQKLAEQLLMGFPMIKSVEITVKKPWAPIGYPLEYVCVNISRGWHTAYLSIGSNMGDRQSNLEFAVEQISGTAGIKDVVVSSFINTSPYGNTSQDDFLNGAIKLQTLWSAHELLRIVNDIENKAGRERIIHWGPRTLDIDILLFDDLVIQDENLIVPHCDMENRAFVLEPMNEIAPYAFHPIKRKPISLLLAELNG